MHALAVDTDCGARPHVQLKNVRVYFEIVSVKIMCVRIQEVSRLFLFYSLPASPSYPYCSPLPLSRTTDPDLTQ